MVHLKRLCSTIAAGGDLGCGDDGVLRRDADGELTIFSCQVTDVDDDSQLHPFNHIFLYNTDCTLLSMLYIQDR